MSVGVEGKSLAAPIAVSVGLARRLAFDMLVSPVVRHANIYPMAIEVTFGLDRQIYAKVYVGRPDGVTWEDISDYVSRIDITKGNADQPVSQLEMTIHNDYPEDYFSPRNRDSKWNQFNETYSPLLWPNREVIVDVALSMPGREPQTWRRLFHGLLGDNIQTSGSSVTVSCRDMAKRLQDCYIEARSDYGADEGVPAETVIQQIMDDNLGATAPSLYCPVSPGFMVTPYTLEYQSVWDAIQQVVSQFGWFLGYRQVNGEYVLTLMEPPRSKDQYSGDNFVLSWEDDIYRQDLDIFDSDVRNAVKVTYYDKATRKAESITVVDGASIAEYGRRAMEIERNNASLIDTEEEAQTLAETVLADLKDLTATTRLDMPFLPTLDVFSGIVLANPLVSSTDDFFGVESVRHTLDFDRGRFRTEVTASGRVVGAHTKWLGMQTRPGASKPIKGDEISGGIVDVDKTEIIRDGLTKVIFGPNGIIAMDANGDYSQLNGSSLAFFKAGSDTPNWYVRRVAAGEATDGEHVSLNWDMKPTVITSIKSMTTLPAVSPGTEVQMLVDAVNITSEGFDVIANSRVVGDNPQEYPVEARLNFVGEEWVSPGPTPDGVTSLRISAKIKQVLGGVGGTVEVLDGVSVRMDYRLSGYSTWINGPTILGASQFYVEAFTGETIHLNVDNIPAGEYEVRVYCYAVKGSAGYVDVVSYGYGGDIVIDSGVVSWIAIEGGA